MKDNRNPSSTLARQAAMPLDVAGPAPIRPETIAGPHRWRALSDLVMRCRHRWVAAAAHRLGDSTLAEDVVQHALVVLIERHFADDGGEARPRLNHQELNKYVYGVIRNLCADAGRRSAIAGRAARRASGMPSPGSDVVDAAASRQLLQFVSPKCCAVIVMRLEGWSFSEIATSLQVTAEAARRRHCDGMKTLRSLIDD